MNRFLLNTSLFLLFLCGLLLPGYLGAEQADEGSQVKVTLFQDPPHSSEVLEALGEKPKFKYRGQKTRSIQINEPVGSLADSPKEEASQVTSPQVGDQAGQEIVQVSNHASQATRPPPKKSGRSSHKSRLALPLVFPSGSAELSRESKVFLDGIGFALKEKGDLTLHISGHTDITGSQDTNKALSLKRAASVRDYLSQNYQIEDSRLTISGEGSGKLLIQANPRAAENRRVEFNKATP